jgi:hypothetical protein
MHRSAAGSNTLPGESPLSASGHFGVGVNERALVTGPEHHPGNGEGPAALMVHPASRRET